MADSITTRARTRSRGTGRGDAFVVGLLLVLLAIAAAAVFLSALGVVQAERMVPDEVLRERLLGWLVEGPAWVRAATASVALGVGLLALWGLSRRISASPSGTPNVHVLMADELGVVVVAREGVEGVARQAVGGAAGVVEADVRVRSRGADAVGLVVHAVVLPGADLQRAGAQARDRAREAVERLVGLRVHEVAVQLEVIAPEDLERTVL